MDDSERSRRAVLGATAAGLAAAAGCSSTGSEGDATGTTEPTEAATDATTRTATEAQVDWRTAELTDVTTGETFTVAGLADAPVILEFFAVWCPVCTRQQQHLATFAADDPDAVPISVNVDPNESAETVRKHAAEHGFDWRYAVAPTDVTSALVDEFGTVVTSPPAAPVARVCPDGDAALLSGRGVKSAGDIAAAVDEC
ncbi:TlpA family protein disulfide reductase [Haloarcula litorea]|uniref:TlpA family protein disulfide reductase n=1 Tax=Haloarcula litorea TaxID=3032579 RepID=UPI0023E7FAAA|nr:redoxin family protein [Halomicroarcula sp. GDY20]